MEHWGLAAMGIAFWAFVAVASVAGIVAEYKKRELELAPLRAAIERGQNLDPLIVEKLMTREPRAPAFDALALRVGGIITVASGAGVALLAYFASQIKPFLFYPLLGAGVLAICVGAGIVLAAHVVERADAARRSAPGTPGPTA